MCSCWPSLRRLWENVQSSLFPFFNLMWVWFFPFSLLSYVSSSCSLDVSHVPDIRSAAVFSHSVGCLVVMLRTPFAVPKEEASLKMGFIITG